MTCYSECIQIYAYNSLFYHYMDILHLCRTNDVTICILGGKSIGQKLNVRGRWQINQPVRCTLKKFVLKVLNEQFPTKMADSYFYKYDFVEYLVNDLI